MTWKDYKTPQKRLERSGTNDWYIIPFVLLAGMVVTMAILGADNVIEVASELITKW